MIAELVTCTKADTGYTLYDLLQATRTANSENPNSIPFQCQSVTIQYLGTTGGYIVPNAGAYSNAAGVPARYGYSFSDSGTYYEKGDVGNTFALNEIVLGAQTDGDKFAVCVYWH